MVLAALAHGGEGTERKGPVWGVSGIFVSSARREWEARGRRGRALRRCRGRCLGWFGSFDILECLPGFKEAKSLGLIHIHFRLKVKDSQPLLISLSLAELCVQGSLAL